MDICPALRVSVEEEDGESKQVGENKSLDYIAPLPIVRFGACKDGEDKEASD